MQVIVRESLCLSPQLTIAEEWNYIIAVLLAETHNVRDKWLSGHSIATTAFSNGMLVDKSDCIHFWLHKLEKRCACFCSPFSNSHT